jgi:hypothetical protein
MNLKTFALTITEYIICLLLYTFFTAPLHEWLHLTTLRRLGGDGYIIQTWWGAETVFTKTPTNPTLVALAGGIGVAILYALIFYWDYYDGDLEEASAVLPLIGSQLAYGIFEALFVYTMPLGQYIYWATIISNIGWATGFIISLNLLIQRLTSLG